MAVSDAAVAPERSLEQRMQALSRANEVRSYRKGLKRQLKHHERLVTTALAAPEPEIETMKVFDLLIAAPKVGRVKANKWLVQSRISHSKTVGGLTDRQRRELMALIRRR